MKIEILGASRIDVIWAILVFRRTMSRDRMFKHVGRIGCTCEQE